MRAAGAAVGLVLLVCLAGSAASAPRFQVGNPYWIDGGRLIGFSGGYDGYEDSWEGYVANADGSARRRVPGVSLSPSGRLTADMSLPAGDECSIFVHQLSGKVFKNFHIPDGGCWVSRPVWSPDERAVLVEVSTYRGEERLVIYRADLRGGLHLLSRTPREDTTPDWSPDGSRIVFVSCAAEPPRVCQIVIADRDGRRRRPIVRDLEGATGYGDPAPLWSPDGRSVAFATPYGPEPSSRTDPPPRRWGIYVVQVDGNRLRRIAVTPYVLGNPAVAWSARSRSVAFRDARGIWTVRVDGSRLHRHTTRSDNHSPVSWAPAQSILFVEDEVIYSVRPGGRVRRVLP